MCFHPIVITQRLQPVCAQLAISQRAADHWQRIRANPLAYGLKIADVRKDPELRMARSNIIAEAAAKLNESCMVRFNPETGTLDTTDLGRVASHYYDPETIRDRPLLRRVREVLDKPAP